MKRMKKLLTGLLTLAMTLSMMTMTAFAAEGGSTATTTKMPTIDTRKDVSLTIHKYEYNGNLKPDGTGSATDVNNVPADLPKIFTITGRIIRRNFIRSAPES